MVQVDPAKRPTIKEVMNSKWMTKTDDEKEQQSADDIKSELKDRFQLLNKEIDEARIQQFIIEYVKPDQGCLNPQKETDQPAEVENGPIKNTSEKAEKDP